MAKKEMKRCCECNRVLTNNEIGLSMKLLGRNIESYFCISCLAVYVDCSIDDLKQKIEDFKSQGCTLFI